MKLGDKLFLFLSRRKLLNFLNDKTYIKASYHAYMNKKINLNNPKTYNEKLNWLKLYDRNPKYIQLVDKYEVKKFISDKIGQEYVIQTLGIYDSFDDIDFDGLPNSFVIKCTHDSGGLVIVKDKNDFNYEESKMKIEKCLKTNYYSIGREWPYKKIKPRILIEKYMEDDVTKELRDYKFFCFNGKVKMMFIASNRQGEGDTYFDFYDNDFNHMPFVQGHPNAPVPPKKPKNFNKMIYLAEKLSNQIPHVRIDFYEVNNKIYFGEMTFFHFSGLVPFKPEIWDRTIGDWIELPSKKEKE